MRRAVFAGSFDPVTTGHIDIVERAASMFDELIVCIFHNVAKEGCFPLEQRVAFLRTATARALRLILGHNFFCAESRLCRFFPKRTALFRKTFKKMHRVLFLFAQILTSLTFRIKKSVFSLIQNHKSKTCYCLFDGSRYTAAPAFLLTTVCHLARVATGLAPYEALLSRQERECHPKRQKSCRPVFCIHYFKFRNSSVRISLRGEAFLLSPQRRTHPPAHSLLRSTSAPSSSRRA